MTRYVYAIIYLKYTPFPWSKELHDELCLLSSTQPCSASEGGFSLDISEKDVEANIRLAKEHGSTAYNMQPKRDLRFRCVNENWELRMKDNMPWTVYELNNLVNAFKIKGIQAEMKIIQ
jgi:hypothetical protein